MSLLLTRADVAQILTMSETIVAVEEGFRQYARGSVDMPQRTVIHTAGGIHLGMPAYAREAGENGALVLKVVTVYSDNKARYGLPSIIATILLNDPRTGALMAIMDGTFLTAMRTGAASAVATKHLAPAGAKTLGIFGAGDQARTQLMAIHEVRSLARVQVFDPVSSWCEEFATRMSEQLGLDVVPARDARECAENEIICTATSSEIPVLDGRWLRPGTHINGVGTHTPNARELDTETVLRSKVVADCPHACVEEAGDLIIPISEGVFSKEQVHAGLGEIINGTRPGRESADEITFFKSVGLAIQDAMTAARVYELAREAKIGMEVDL